MQYLSKAYSYYSGINPATLSGAIDVIVVRHAGDDGQVVLSSTPFHVRFGKLQVLRAGEKRVTLRLPNNLPHPHVAPFSMKVGEAGEAFFVLETDEEVPDELITSPVVMPTDGPVPPAPPLSDDDFSSSPEEEAGPSLTQQPFGQTEKQGYEDEPEPLADVDYLDLNDGQKTRLSPSSLIHSASSLLPSIPFLSSPPSPAAASPERRPSGDTGNSASQPQRMESKIVFDTDGPPNPVASPLGGELPSYDHRLAEHRDLPKVAPGQGEGPQVVYGKDVVLDIAGYHSAGELLEDSPGADSAVVQRLIEDLTYASATKRPPSLVSGSEDSAGPASADLPDALASLGMASTPTSRFDRGQSEPPPDIDEGEAEDASPSDQSSRIPESPPNLSRPLNGAIFPGATSSTNPLDLAWDWGRSSAELAPGQRNRRERMRADSSKNGTATQSPGFKNVEENPHLFVFESEGGRFHSFELATCGSESFATGGEASDQEKAVFLKQRITFQRFIEDPKIVDDPHLVLKYNSTYLTWSNSYRLLFALSMYRRSLTPPTTSGDTLPTLSDLGVIGPPRPVSGYGWSRWWRRGESGATVSQPPQPPRPLPSAARRNTQGDTSTKHYAKTLRLSSDQLKQLCLKPGPNTVQFSVTSSYSGVATCAARIFLWDERDQIVISDIDGTITKSDALGHVFAAIGRDWTHLGIAKLYTDICNNGYKIMYLTSRAIGQADSTREYLRSIIQGDYRLPEGPVIMSPDRLMVSLHREVIMRKPELFKMACLRDIQRLFGEQAKEAFFAGFGNRITDAMSYRSVGIDASKIYTIDSTGVVKTELLQAAGHKGSYIQLNDLVNETFPPVSTKVKPEYSDFNYWRSSFPEVELPNLSPPSPALSARSDSSRYSVLGKIASIGRRSSKQPLLPISNDTSRPSSPLMAPAVTPDDLSEADDTGSRVSSMPGSLEDKRGVFPADIFGSRERDVEEGDEHEDDTREDSFDDGAIFDDDILATGEMRNVPF